jgi:hypothetical protein
MGARQYVPSLGRFLQVDPVAGGSCNDYDYVCGDPVNGFDLDGRKGNRPLENRDAECLGGTYAQITSDPCRAYQLAKATGDSDFYYEGKTYSTPGKPNAFLTKAGSYVDDAFKGVAFGTGIAAIVFTGPVGAGLAASSAITTLAVPVGKRCSTDRLSAAGASAALSGVSAALSAVPGAGRGVVAGANAAGLVSTGTTYATKRC